MACFGDGLDDLVSFDCRQHYLCSVCAKSSLEVQLGSGKLPKCPIPDCQGAMKPVLAERLLNPREFELYLMLNLRATKRYETCPHKGCGAGIVIDDAVSEAWEKSKSGQDARFQPGLATALRCPRCTKTFCMICFHAAHPRHTCEEARRKRPAQIGGGDAEGLDARGCPRCGTGICKANESDCDHMTCSHCKKEFCWSCSADRQVIYAHGNHHHFPSCRFYAAYDGPSEHKPQQCPECRRLERACKPPKVHKV